MSAFLSPRLVPVLVLVLVLVLQVSGRSGDRTHKAPRDSLEFESSPVASRRVVLPLVVSSCRCFVVPQLARCVSDGRSGDRTRAGCSPDLRVPSGTLTTRASFQIISSSLLVSRLIRRGWGSNPRWPLDQSPGFEAGPLPLGHPSNDARRRRSSILVRDGRSGDRTHAGD